MPILFFSEKWFEKISTDAAWITVKLYIYELAWNFFNFWRNQVSYSVTFSYIQKIHNLKPNPYLVDTVKHFFAILTGHAPAYAPACDEEALPMNLLNRAFVESYNLKKYHAIIMQPTNFIRGGTPVYYSLQHPSTFAFSPTSRRLKHTLYEMHELIRLVEIFKKDLARDNFPCSDTVLGEAARVAQFDYFHTKEDSHNIIKLAKKIADDDPRFHNSHLSYKVDNAVIPHEAPFVRGCIRLSTHESGS